MAALHAGGSQLVATATRMAAFHAVAQERDPPVRSDEGFVSKMNTSRGNVRSTTGSRRRSLTSSSTTTSSAEYATS